MGIGSFPGPRGADRVTPLAEAARMRLIEVMFGLLIGVLVEWYVLRVFPVETGFAFPVRLPSSGGAMIAELIGLSAAIAGLRPVLGASLMRVSEWIASERPANRSAISKGRGL
jgi:hypothetical protein